MLEIRDIRKEYVTGDLRQVALDGVSLNLRDNEFVAILGPSGSGKTTLLNVIGGLDRYDSGDLIINGISTKRYSDHDWDSYRNHTIGFVFQSYNLIPHQSILANVELALTISGVSRKERRERATQALEKVGLGEQVHKRPNQLSGGQMQRVAIARALVNDPDILLADEPTGALDTDTSVQVMELLKQVAEDRLVVMVTHNPDLAHAYATRIVSLRDGKITGDSDPCAVDEAAQAAPRHENMGRASMSFRTALSLSFNNLRTKKGRTFLTAFAGSIGIIGIALILSLSTGVNNYIDDIQKSTMTSYPITIQAQSIDLSAMMSTRRETVEGLRDGTSHALDAVYANNTGLEMVSSMTMSVKENNLTQFKKYLDDSTSAIHQYIGENGIVYSYDTQFDVYTHDPDGALVNTDGSTLSGTRGAMGGMGMMSSFMGTSSGNSNLTELLPGQGEALISQAVLDSYDLLDGTWPAAFDEVVLMVDRNNEIGALTLYQLGLLPTAEYQQLMRQLSAGEEVTVSDHVWRYADIRAQELLLLPACDRYVEHENGLFTDISENSAAIEAQLQNAIPLKIVGVVRPAEDATYAATMATLGYTHALTDYLIDYTNHSAVVAAQEASPEINVLSGVAFTPADDAARAADTLTWLNSLTTAEKADLCREYMSQMGEGMGGNAQAMMNLSDTALATMFDRYLLSSDSPNEAQLLMIYDRYIASGSYDENMAVFGVVSLDAPSSISLYADSFEDKDAISGCIEAYNKTVSEEYQITYTDYVGLLMSSVTTIVNVISYVLIAFVSVSLVVSSIMIGIITYISVLERTKEIGILRAIGASKHNISQVFNAETFIIGLLSGLIGVGVSLLLLIPVNAVIHAVSGSINVNAALPLTSAGLLVLLSVILTLIGGLIPSRKAARKDPVAALRTE